MLKYAQEVGWQYVSPEDALRLRGGETGIVFKETFLSKVQELNPGFMDQAMAQDLLRRIELIPATIEGNLTAWEYLRGLKTVFVPSEKRERNARFIDSDNISNNVFQVTDEYSYTNGKETIRPDVVFLINGVPVLFVEAKAAHKRDGIAMALDQVKRYHVEAPELMAVLQLYALTHIAQFFYSSTWSSSRKGLFNWKEEIKGNYESLVKTFFEPSRVVKLITDFILFTRKDDELKKVVLRPHQVRAVEKILQRAEDNNKSRGLIWHTQGSGKTYTMIVAAEKILKDLRLRDPTVIMLVDRNELESQLFGNLSSIGVSNVVVAGSKAELQSLLRNDHRGLIVSMIHKFEGVEKDANTRDNIYVLVDEAHRTTGGSLGNYLMGALPNATYIGFTGTPIDKIQYGRGTFKTFGGDDLPYGYLDKYGIAESIEDGTTVPLRYTLAPNELRVDRATLESEFLNLVEAEGMSDIEELNKVLERAVTLKNMLKNRERVAKVAEFVALHFKEYVEPMGYKAFLVAVDREACAMYKEELDRQGIIPSEYSEVVYSSGFNDPPEMAKYHLSKDSEKKVRKAFTKRDELPKLLIVTEKLLTGFDAPILYCLYLDKPMRDHVLLQTIARVNRPYEDLEGRKKPSGFVLDFVGIFENLEKALAFDSSDMTNVMEHLDRLKDDFALDMGKARSEYLSIIKGLKSDKAVDAIIEHFIDEEKRHEFYEFFKDLESLYEILSPDAFLRDYINDFETLGRMYSLLRETYEPGISVERDFLRKTAQLVQEHTRSGSVIPPLEIYEINEDTLKKIEDSKQSDNTKVFNISRSVDKLVEAEGKGAPFLLSIGQRAEEIIAKYQQRQIDTQEALEALKQLVREINLARAEQKSKGMSVDAFSVYWLMDREGVPEATEKANRMEEVFQKYPHWKESERYEREVRAELYKILAKSGVRDLVGIVNKILNVLRENT
jgi:type I restriction enzyme R subunit